MTMNKHSSIKSAGSLLERASEMYDFGAALRGGLRHLPCRLSNPILQQRRVVAAACFTCASGSCSNGGTSGQFAISPDQPRTLGRE